MAQTETQQIVSGQVYNVSYSADGRYLSYTQDAGNVGTLYVVDLTDPGFKRAIDSEQLTAWPLSLSRANFRPTAASFFTTIMQPITQRCS